MTQDRSLFEAAAAMSATMRDAYGNLPTMADIESNLKRVTESLPTAEQAAKGLARLAGTE